MARRRPGWGIQFGKRRYPLGSGYKGFPSAADRADHLYQQAQEERGWNLDDYTPPKRGDDGEADNDDS